MPFCGQSACCIPGRLRRRRRRASFGCGSAALCSLRPNLARGLRAFSAKVFQRGARSRFQTKAEVVRKMWPKKFSGPRRLKSFCPHLSAKRFFGLSLRQTCRSLHSDSQTLQGWVVPMQSKREEPVEFKSQKAMNSPGPLQIVAPREPISSPGTVRSRSRRTAILRSNLQQETEVTERCLSPLPPVKCRAGSAAPRASAAGGGSKSTPGRPPAQARLRRRS